MTKANLMLVLTMWLIIITSSIRLHYSTGDFVGLMKNSFQVLTMDKEGNE